MLLKGTKCEVHKSAFFRAFPAQRSIEGKSTSDMEKS
jgi:hypothetical protein